MDTPTENSLQDRIPSSISHELLESFKKTHNIIDRPEKFAEMFTSVAESQNAVRNKLAEILVLSIQHDVPTRAEMKKVLKEIYDEDWKRFIRSAWGKLALLGWTLLVAWLTHVLFK